MESLLQDVRYTLRLLRRSPGFTAAAVVALALGIGASSAIFSVIHTIVLKPLPYARPEELVQLWMRFTGIGLPKNENWVSAPEYLDLQHNGSLAALAAQDETSFNITFGGVPEHVDGALVTPGFFPLLGVQAEAGRVFAAEEGTAGHERVALISDALWRRRFGADPAVAGRKLLMSGVAHVIVGVLPPWFHQPRDAEVWAPLAFKPEDLTPDNRGSHGLQVIARLRPGLTLAQARADLAVVGARITREHPEYPYRDYNFTVLAVPLLEQQIGDVRTALWVLMGAVGFVLLIACANVANLLLVRASAREREIAVRQALGVGRARLVRQLLTESAILGLAGGAAGLGFAWWTLRVLTATSATAFPRMAEVRLEVPVLLFTFLVSLATGLLFGLAPALAAARGGAQAALKEGGRGSSVGAGARRLRSALVIAEIALSSTLLAGSGLLIRSFIRLQEVDAGFRPGGVLTMRIALPEQKYGKPAQARQFYRELLERVRRLPGVDAAGAVTGLPLTGTGWSGTVTVDTQAVPLKDTTPEAEQRPVTPGFFAAMGMVLVRGRGIAESDGETSPRVCVIDESLAREYWPHEDPIGRRLHAGGRGGGEQPAWMTVVGVVRHVRYHNLELPSRVEVYWPYAQTPFAIDNLSLAIHGAVAPRTLASAVRREILALDPDQPVYRVRTMGEVLAESVAGRRLSMLLLAIFAGVALLLAAVGIFGVMSYMVAQRAHEMGIRMALGARAAEVMRLVLGQSVWLTAAGLAGSLLLNNLIAGLLFAVRAYDPPTLLAVALLLALVATAASCVPAWRASAVDPVSSLRQE
jgi:putative ABC transport system permease protein